MSYWLNTTKKSVKKLNLKFKPTSMGKKVTCGNGIRKTFEMEL